MSAPAVGTAAQPLNPEHESIQAEREHNGRFAAGNRGGPGNPFARRVAELRKAFIEAVSYDDLQRICQRLICLAVQGDVAAAKLVLGYVLGKFPEPVNPDTLDQDEVRLYSQNLSMTELQEAQNVSPPRVSVAVLRATSLIREGNARGILFPEERTRRRTAAKPSAASPSTNRANGPSEAPSANGANGAAAASPSINGGNGALGKRKPSPLWRQAVTGERPKAV